MYKHILDKLTSIYIVSSEKTEAMEQYIASEYPNLSKDEAHKVLIQYLHQQLEETLTYFDEKYLPYIKFRLIRNMIIQRPYQITALDMLKACIQLNFGIDSFYRELTQWLQIYTEDIPEWERRSFVEKLKQVPAYSVDKSLEELLAEERNVPSVTSLAVVNVNPFWQENQKGGLVPFESEQYFKHNEWMLFGKDTDSKKRNLSIARNIAIVIISLAVLIAGSMWLLSTCSYKSSQLNTAVQPDQDVTQPPKVSELKTTVAADAYVRENRTLRNAMVNRSRPGKKQFELSKGKAIKPLKVQPLKVANIDDKMVTVGYQEVIKDGMATRAPIVKSYSTKLVMNAKGYASTAKSIDASAVNGDATTAGGAVSATAVKAIKNRTIAVGSRLIPAGSRVYVNFPPEYKHLDGIYTTEEASSRLKGNQMDVYFGEEVEGDNAVSKRIDAFGSKLVDVYLLK